MPTKRKVAMNEDGHTAYYVTTKYMKIYHLTFHLQTNITGKCSPEMYQLNICFNITHTFDI